MVPIKSQREPNYDKSFLFEDSENLNSVAQLFQYLKSEFQFSLVVSHIESMRDFVDTLLEIKKVGGSSSVRFSRN